MNFIYKLFTKKHVLIIVLPNIPYCDEYDPAGGENVLDVPPIYGNVRSHLLKVLIQEYKVIQEIVATSTTRNGMVKGLIQMLNPKDASTSSYQVVV